MKRITKIENRPGRVRKLKVAAYCRVSTGRDEQLISLEAQKQHYEEYIRAHSDWEYAGLYYDEGITGTRKDKRPALQQMIADCEDGRIDFIVTKSISRFARNTADCLELVRGLYAMGVFIFFERENINTRDMEGELMLTILSSLAEEESVSISQNTKWSVQKRFENGTYKIGYPPFGYRNNGGRMEVVREEAEVVKKIFDWYLSGMSTRTIAGRLIEMGVRTKKGGTWQGGTVSLILKNEKYTGDVIFGKTFTDDLFTRHTNRGETEQYLVRDHHEAIIDRDTFERVQELLEQHRVEKNIIKGSEKYNRSYAFSGKIICGNCGSTFKRQKIKTKEGDRIAWCCSSHLDDKTVCDVKNVRQETIEASFATMLNKLIFGKDIVLKPLIDGYAKKSKEGNLGKLNRLEEDIERARKKKDRLRKLISSGVLDADVFNDENNKILEELAYLNSEKERVMTEERFSLMRRREAESLYRFANNNAYLESYDELLFRQFVDHIVVYDRTKIGFVLKCGLTLTEEGERCL